MTILRFTFLWEEEDTGYDQMVEQLMFLGAYDIEDEEVKPEPEVERPKKTRKKQ